MANPTKGEINRLGDRLRKSATPSRADLAALSAWIDRFGPVQVEVVRRLSAIEGIGRLEVTSRLKTVQTIVYKLKHRPKMNLVRMQDIAGARIVVEDWRAQDDLVALIIQQFGGAKVDDKRSDESMSHGYRAVHVIPAVDGLPAEIQVRTEFQHMWAMILEAVANDWGRQIRYGEPPASTGDPSEDAGRTRTVTVLQALSSGIAQVEASGLLLDKRRSAIQALDPTDPRRNAAINALNAKKERQVESARELVSLIRKVVEATFGL